MLLGLFAGRGVRSQPASTLSEDLHADRNLLLLSAGGAEEETRCRKSAAPKSGWLGGASAWPVFGAAQRASLPRSEHSRAAGRGRLASSSSLGRLGEEHTHPFCSQMAKVELEGFFCELRPNGVLGSRAHPLPSR